MSQSLVINEDQKYKAVFQLLNTQVEYQAWIADKFNLLVTIIPELETNKEINKKLNAVMETLIENHKKAFTFLSDSIKKC